jgi:hypothetical protein
MITWQMCFVNLKQENEKEFFRLSHILIRTKNRRIKKKLGKRITHLCMK